MLSRTADSLFWLNRYMERTDSLQRLLYVHYILSLDKGVNAPQNWRSVLELATSMNPSDIAGIEHNMTDALNKVIADTGNVNSLKIIVHRARENARGVQDYITKETWEEVNQVYHYINHPDISARLGSNEALRVIEDLERHAVMYAGMIELTMPRGTGWNFMCLGKYIERCFHTVHLLQNQLKSIGYNIEQPVNILQWRYLLLSLSGYEMHLKTYTGNHYTENLLHQVIWNENFPRSVLYSLHRINIYLKKVMSVTDNSRESKAMINTLGKLYGNIKYIDPESLTEQSIQPFLENINRELSAFSIQLAQHFFSYD